MTTNFTGTIQVKVPNTPLSRQSGPLRDSVQNSKAMKRPELQTYTVLKTLVGSSPSTPDSGDCGTAIASPRQSALPSMDSVLSIVPNATVEDIVLRARLPMVPLMPNRVRRADPESRTNQPRLVETTGRPLSSLNSV